MMGRKVDIHFSPPRIVSLVPSQTEFLVDIGAQVVGRTKFCVHPEDKVKGIPVVGGTKNFRFERIKELVPDLIIGNKEENYPEGIQALEKEFPVWMSDIYTLDDAFQMMRSLGEICDKTCESDRIIAQCQGAMDEIKGSKSGTVIYLIWQNPWMAVGQSTFIDHMLDHLGYENLIKEARYPELTSQQIAALNPDYLFFSSEPYPFNEAQLEEARKQWPNAKCQLVDGEIFSWYGSRLKYWNESSY